MKILLERTIDDVRQGYLKDRIGKTVYPKGDVLVQLLDSFADMEVDRSTFGKAVIGEIKVKQ